MYLTLIGGEHREKPYIRLLLWPSLLLCCHFALLNTWQKEVEKTRTGQAELGVRGHLNKMFGVSFKCKNKTRRIISNSGEGGNATCANKSLGETKPEA